MVRLRFRATFAANLGHVFTILTDDLAALVPGFAGFLRGELVGGAFFVGLCWLQWTSVRNGRAVTRKEMPRSAYEQ
jgi:hypothetical protein